MIDLLPAKPTFHPSDTMRTVNQRVDSFYNDLVHLFKNARPVYQELPGHWREDSDGHVEKIAYLVAIKDVEFTDDDLVTRVENLDPKLAAHLLKRLNR